MTKQKKNSNPKSGDDPEREQNEMKDSQGRHVHTRQTLTRDQGSRLPHEDNRNGDSLNASKEEQELDSNQAVPDIDDSTDVQ